MENANNSDNVKTEEAEINDSSYNIPKVNMQFDGSSWKNQGVAQQEDIDTKKPPLPPEQTKTSPKSGGSNEDSDHEFEYGGNENIYDDEETVDEEEAADDGEGDAEELNDLAKESEMPLDDLIALYYNKQESDSTEYNSNEENQKRSNNDEKTETNESDDNEDLTRQLRSSSSFLSPNHHQSADEDEDHDYVPPLADDWKKAPRVGDQYQTDNIPETKHQSPDYDFVQDQLIWNPDCLDEEKVKSYLKVVGEGQNDPNTFALPSGSHLRDNEDALFILTQCNSDVDEAVKKFRQRPPNLANDLTVWTEEECRSFEQGLTVYGKDFHQIHLHCVKNKSIGETVKFYYIWKKSERYDLFNAKTRLGKKKDTMHPGVTDYMERLLDETEHSIAAHHGAHTNPSNAPYPLPLTHTAALQQHLVEARMTRRHNRAPNAYDSESPSIDYPEMNGLVDGDYPDEIEMIDGIAPSFSSHNYNPAPFVPIDPALNTAYANSNHFAPVVSTNHQPELVSVSAFPANRNNNSHVVASSNQVYPTNQSTGAASIRTTTVPPDVLSSIAELATAYIKPTVNNLPITSTTIAANIPTDSLTSIDSPSEREPNTVNLKRFQSSPGHVIGKKAKVDDTETSFRPLSEPADSSRVQSVIQSEAINLKESEPRIMRADENSNVSVN